MVASRPLFPGAAPALAVHGPQVRQAVRCLRREPAPSPPDTADATEQGTAGLPEPGPRARLPDPLPAAGIHLLVSADRTAGLRAFRHRHRRRPAVRGTEESEVV